MSFLSVQVLQRDFLKYSTLIWQIARFTLYLYFLAGHMKLLRRLRPHPVNVNRYIRGIDMKRLAVEPRSPEWFEIRAESWTASTAAVLCVRENAELLRDCAAARGVTLDIEPLLKVGLDSFYGNTLWTEWAVKTNRIPREKDNPHMARGKENETRIVRYFEEKKMFVVEPDVTVTSTPDPWLLASFDALAPASSDTSVIAPYGYPVEAKAPAFGTRKKLWDSKKEGKLAIMGLPYYWCQVQHQILVAEAPYGWFVAAGIEPNKTTGVEEIAYPIIEQVPRDEEYLRAYYAAAKFYFDTYIYPCEEPPKVATDLQLLESLEAEATFDRAMAGSDIETAVNLYLETLKEEKEAEARRKMLEAKVLEAAAKMRAEGQEMVLLADRLEVTYSAAKGSVSWQKVAKELAAKAGLPAVPDEVIKSCTGAPGAEKTALKEIV
ncbi:hypothetical protein G3A43_07680 [Paraburkholderia aspalathi]|nr:YqaJ viral recombinase family protein [Paraburkholderia aspalathi]MBK3780135.1 hypothetical protein [Paraburkholderia aspalathi]